jgi:hypothetical protein
MAKRSCGKCEFWEFAPVDGGDDDYCRFPGQCRKNAPPLTETGDARWPVTVASEWCGQFSPVITLTYT